MKTEVKATEAVGKTLASVEFSGSFCGGQCVLSFTDGTFATLGVESGHESGEEEIVEEKLSVFDFGDDALSRAGIVSAEEMTAMRSERDARHQEEREARQEAHDRQEFKRLKQKFGA